MKWTEQKPDVEAAAVSNLFRELSAVDVLLLLSHIRSSAVVVFDSACRNGVEEHLQSRMTELGGLLIGWPYVPSPGLPQEWRPIIHVSDFLPSQSFRTSRVSLSMSTEIWDRARESVSSRGRMVVGWYHSHPNLGAFFSGTDRKTQRSFFNQQYSLGLVADPVRREEAWFAGADATALSPGAVFAFDSPASHDLGERFHDITRRPVGSSRVDLQACKLEYSIVSPK